MYSMERGTAIQTDWLQLGLMVCWVLDPELGQEEKERDYHNRDCKKICESLQDTFLKSLIGLPSKQLGRLAFLGPHLCLSIPTEALCSTFICFFAFPLGKFGMDQLNEWCKNPCDAMTLTIEKVLSRR